MTVVAEVTHGGVHPLHVVVDGAIRRAGHQHRRLTRGLDHAVGNGEIAHLARGHLARLEAGDGGLVAVFQVGEIDHAHHVRLHGAHIGEGAAEVDLKGLILHRQGVGKAVE